MKRIPHEDEWEEWELEDGAMTRRAGWTFLVMWVLGFVAGWVAGKFV